MAEGPVPGPSYQVPALEKGLDILECLAGQAVPLTQMQLARALGRGPNELFRMLVVLERRGYIQRDAVSGAYSLTLRLFELGHTHSPLDGLLRAAARPMRALADSLRESCHLSVERGGKLVVVAQEAGAQPLRLSVEIGAPFPLLQTVSGRVLVAHLPPQELEETLAGDGEYAALGAAERAALHKRLAAIRKRGYEQAYSESREGVRDLAVLVGAPAGRLRAALAIASLTRKREAPNSGMLPALKGCAEEIGRAAGLIV